MVEEPCICYGCGGVLGDFGYCEDCDDEAMEEAEMNDKKFLKIVLKSLESLDEKQLISNRFQSAFGVCAIGSLGMIDFDSDDIAAHFHVSPSVVDEVINENDRGGKRNETRKQRWIRVHAWLKTRIEQL
jgi:hypothetical protein